MPSTSGCAPESPNTTPRTGKKGSSGISACYPVGARRTSTSTVRPPISSVSPGRDVARCCAPIPASARPVHPRPGRYLSCDLRLGTITDENGEEMTRGVKVRRNGVVVCRKKKPGVRYLQEHRESNPTANLKSCNDGGGFGEQWARARGFSGRLGYTSNKAVLRMESLSRPRSGG